MGRCPKCKSRVAVEDTKCRKCGALLGVPDASGTLNAEQHFQLSKDADSVPMPNDASKTVTDVDASGDASGTLGIGDLPKDSPSGTLSESINQVSDSSKTLRLDAGDEDESPGSTQNFSESDLRSAMGFGDSGSDGQLERVFKAAIGSSGKDSNQSLRYERAEASDSVFRRVAVRQIADANSTLPEGADYQIKDKLGEGGMGMVYSALQTAVNRIVAIKTIKPEKFENASARKQFFYEAEVTAELDHPNIPAIYELGKTEDGTLFYTMKLIRGIDWQKLLRKKTQEENLEIFDKITDAVAFAHSKNVIHRDLKPENVMLGSFGEIYLSDWGLAVNQSKNKDIEFGGTPEFMAPEMAKNQRNQIGKHSDIYLLGAILYQIVTGTPPHMGRTQRDRWEAAKKNSITPTDKQDPLIKIALRAMETEPSLRHKSVAEFQDEIREVKTHAESIADANRASEIASNAAQSQDYEGFSEAIFGFRAALDKWGGNDIAKFGLQKARLAYGQCAFDKGSYDVALQTLDRSIPEHAEVYEKATKAKLAVEQSKSRFKTLSRVFVAAVSTLLLVVTGVAIIAEGQRRSADTERKEANKQRDLAKENFATAEEQRKEANKQRDLAKENFAAAEEQRKEANKQRDLAKENFATAEEQRKEANKQRDLAKENFATAEEQRKLAFGKTAQISASNVVSGIRLAELAATQFDTQEASQTIEKIRKIKGEEFARTDSTGKVVSQNIPKFDTFALQRVDLLANSDLPKIVTDNVSAMDFAPAVNVGIVGTKSKGQLQVLRYGDAGLKSETLHAEYPGSSIDCVAISPNGDEAMFSKTTGTTSSTYVWSLVDNTQPVEATVLGNKSFQAMRYSPDGKRIVVGINSGIRVLSREEKWTSKDDKDIKEIDLKKNFRGARGDLVELQWIGANTVLASANIDGKLSLFEVDMDTRSSEKVTVPESLSAAAKFGSDNKVLLAFGEGKLGIGELTRGKEKKELVIGNLSELEDKHRARISKLVVHPNGRILSMSKVEPVVHVWQSKAGGDVTYETYLTGVPSSKAFTPNIINAMFASGDAVLGVDDSGTTFAWNVERQKQRRQLSRGEEYPTSVVGVYSRGKTQPQQAISVTEDGVIDLWNVQTGKSVKIDDAARFSYFGHTPNAVFVDSAVDVKSGRIVTSALLDKVDRRYLKEPTHNWEFCVWDQSTGNMLKRWSMAAPKDSTEPRMSMLNDGKEILIASFSPTLVTTLDGEPVKIDTKNEVGTYFAVPNPKNSSLIAMVKQSSLVWLWDRSDANSWWESDPNNLLTRSQDEEGIPLKGIWTEDGSRFVLICASGLVKVYDQGNFRKPSFVFDYAKTRKEQVETKEDLGIKIQQHHDIDLATARVGDGVDRLAVNIRFPRIKPESVAFTMDIRKSKIEPGQILTVAGLRWLDTTVPGMPKSSNIVHPGFRVNTNSNDRVLSSQKYGTHTYVSTTIGTVYDLADESTTAISVGPQKLISSTCDRDGRVVMLLREDGSLLRMDLSEEGKGNLVMGGFKAKGFNEIQLSPNKSQLAMFNRDTHQLRIVDAVSGELVQQPKVAAETWDKVAAVTWDPAGDTDLALVDTDGKVKMIGMNGLNEPVELGSVNVENSRQVKSVHFFNEAFVAEGAKRYLLVQTETKNTAGEELSGRIEFVALKPELDKDRIKGLDSGLKVKSGLTIATSPVDSLFVTGDEAGIVSVWFASPTWDKPGKIFDLEGHRGAKIKSIAFGENGRTLMTSDSNKRLYSWMSKDSTTPKN